MKTIIAAFCDSASAQQALQYLQGKGITDAQLVGYDQGGVMSQLSGYDVPDDKAQLYAEVVRRGASLIVAHTEHDARSMAHELDRMGSLDLDAAAKRWKKAGWNGYDSASLPYDAQACASERTQLMDESRFASSQDTTASRDLDDRDLEGRDIDVIEEKVNIGKRAVQRGGVRVRTFVTERPVNEEVQLREERIDVAREPVNERISPNAVDSTFNEEEFVVTAQGEEAVVGKEARIVERVHVGKVAETRTESIEETERRRDVDVQQIDETRNSRR